MKIKCIKDVVMSSGDIVFTKGNVYATYYNIYGLCATNDLGIRDHAIKNDNLESFYVEHFSGDLGKIVSSTIPTKLMHTNDPIFLPYRKHVNDAGADLRARIDSSIRLHSGQITKIPTGIAISIPEGYVGIIQPRSGASSEGKLVITGTIDSGYVGEMSMSVFNPVDSNYVVIQAKERIAQLVVVPYLQAEFVQVDELGKGDRGTEGFGSTGRE